MDLSPKFSDEHVGGAEWRATRPIDSLPGSLGFIETGDIQNLRHGAVSALVLGGKDGPELLQNYKNAVNQLKSTRYPDGNGLVELGSAIAECLVLRDAGMRTEYAQYLQRLLLDAAHLDHYEAAAIIGAEIESLNITT